MEKLCTALLLTLALSSCAFASENGGYYECEADALTNNQCIFALTGEEPDDWIHEPVLHDVDREVGANFCRGVESYAGVMLSVSPKPWVNGDALVGSSDAVTGDNWNAYTLVFELMAPLRDMMMYEPGKLDDTTWATYTKALTDCNSKITDYDSTARSGGGTPWSTEQVHAFVGNPEYTDIHHFVLQYLEEGTMDLVCLTSDLEMEHCDAIREAAGWINDGDRCNCWFDAYKAIYGECPVVDGDFITCGLTNGSTDCADVQATVSDGVVCGEDDTADTDETDATLPEPTGDMPAPPDMPDMPVGPPARR